MNIVMGFSCTGGEMERLVLLVLSFFKERKGAIRGCKERPSFVIVLLYGKVWCTV